MGIGQRDRLGAALFGKIIVEQAQCTFGFGKETEVRWRVLQFKTGAQANGQGVSFEWSGRRLRMVRASASVAG